MRVKKGKKLRHCLEYNSLKSDKGPSVFMEWDTTHIFEKLRNLFDELQAGLNSCGQTRTHHMSAEE